MTNNMLQTTAYSMNPYIFVDREAQETHRAQQIQKQIRAFITGEGYLNPIYHTEYAIADLCVAVMTVTGKEYDETREGLVEGWYDLERLVLAWQSPYGAGAAAQSPPVSAALPASASTKPTLVVFLTIGRPPVNCVPKRVK